MLYILSTNVRHPDPGLILYYKDQTSRYTVSECPSTAFSQYLLDGATTCHRNQVNTSVQQSCRRGQRFLSACLVYSGEVSDRTVPLLMTASDLESRDPKGQFFSRRISVGVLVPFDQQRPQTSFVISCVRYFNRNR